MSAAQFTFLERAGWPSPAPFVLALPGGGSLQYRNILRWLPGRRVSGEASWDGRPVFAKLFFGAAARRHAEREQQGLAALQSAGLPTPALLAVVDFPRGERLLLSEFMPAARSLEAALGDPAKLSPALALLGRLHAAGLVHDDLHLGNFLLAEEKMLLIDGDGVRPGSAEQQRDNLALLLSQLPVALDGWRAGLLSAYGELPGSGGLDDLVDAWRQRRRQRFLAKTLRDCTQFSVVRESGRFLAVLRSAGTSLLPLLAAPDQAIEQGRRLKSGATCTVAALAMDGGPLVVKRYNRKNWRHALSRAWRPSRAWHSWREAHRLAFYGIATPKPLALLEERWGPLRGRAFLVTEFCPGVSLADALLPERVPEPALAQSLEVFFAVLCRLRITHGDLKATNLLWHEGQLWAIDLDAMTQHRSASAFRRAWRRDRARFLRNWPAGSPLHDWLARILPPV
ncbi:lipopolysaccharide kinase InaA family protein [Azonexus sp.]|uniref:lipopolysaccharide kinase InaA family protein n=1 Tax=Azonexus sp. TaxID=1872668 RepID=UPI0035B262CD